MSGSRCCLTFPTLVLESPFDATENLVTPFPEPLPAVIVIHAALLEADQLQPDGAVTAILPLPPEDANDLLVGDSDTLQAAATV